MIEKQCVLSVSQVCLTVRLTDSGVSMEAWLGDGVLEDCAGCHAGGSGFVHPRCCI